MNSNLIKATAQSETSPELNSYGNELPVKVLNTQSVLTEYDIINLLSYLKKQLMDHLLVEHELSTAPLVVNCGNSSNICDRIQW